MAAKKKSKKQKSYVPTWDTETFQNGFKKDGNAHWTEVHTLHIAEGFCLRVEGPAHPDMGGGFDGSLIFKHDPSDDEYTTIIEMPPVVTLDEAKAVAFKKIGAVLDNVSQSWMSVILHHFNELLKSVLKGRKKR